MAAPPLLPAGTPLHDIHTTYGAIYIGCLVSIGLLGMAIVQAWVYYNQFPKDPLWTKFVVMAICVLEILRSTFTSHAVYYYLVRNWGNIFGLTTIVWSLQSIVMTTNVSKLFVHLFFSWRIYTLSPHGKVRHLLSTMAVLITLFDFGATTAAFVNVVHATDIHQYVEGSQRILVPFAIAAAMTTDATLSICLIFLLARSKTGFSRTNRLLNSLIFYAVEAGCLTVMVGVACLTLNHFVNNSNIGFDFIGVYAVSGNLYGNSLLATLNTRIKLTIHAAQEEKHMVFTRGNTFSTARTGDAHTHRAVHLQTFATVNVDTLEDSKLGVEGASSISSSITRPETTHVYGP